MEHAVRHGKVVALVLVLLVAVTLPGWGQANNIQDGKDYPIFGCSDD